MSSVFETGELPQDEVGRLLAEHLVQPRWPGASISSFKVDRQRFTPGKEMTTAVSMELTGGGAPSGRQQAVLSYIPEKTLKRVAGSLRRAPQVASGAIVLDRDAGFVIELFPGDWRLPALPAALDAEALAEKLQTYMPRGSYERLEVRLLRYRPHTRALMNIIYRDGSGNAIVDGMGKIFATRGGAEDSWNALKALEEQSGGRPVAPLPLHYEPEWRFVLMEKVAGKPMQPILAAGLSVEGRAAISKAASAMSRFHGMHVEFEEDEEEEDEAETRLLADELFEVRDQAAKFAGIAGWLSDAALDICNRIEAHNAKVGDVPLQLVHGSMKGEQVIVTEDHAVIVDLDGIGMGDPYVDLGNFTAKQFKDARQPGWDHLDDYGQQFMQEYLELAGGGAALEHRAKLFESISLARLAFRELHTARRDLAEAREASPSGRLIERARLRLEEAEQV